MKVPPGGFLLSGLGEGVPGAPWGLWPNVVLKLRADPDLEIESLQQKYDFRWMISHCHLWEMEVMVDLVFWEDLEAAKLKISHCLLLWVYRSQVFLKNLHLPFNSKFYSMKNTIWYFKLDVKYFLYNELIKLLFIVSISISGTILHLKYALVYLPDPHHLLVITTMRKIHGIKMETQKARKLDLLEMTKYHKKK